LEAGHWPCLSFNFITVKVHPFPDELIFPFSATSAPYTSAVGLAVKQTNPLHTPQTPGRAFDVVFDVDEAEIGAHLEQAADHVLDIFQVLQSARTDQATR